MDFALLSHINSFIVHAPLLYHKLSGNLSSILQMVDALYWLHHFFPFAHISLQILAIRFLICSWKYCKIFILKVNDALHQITLLMKHLRESTKFAVSKMVKSHSLFDFKLQYKFKSMAKPKPTATDGCCFLQNSFRLHRIRFHRGFFVSQILWFRGIKMCSHR